MDRKEAIEIVRSNFPNGRIQLSEALMTLIPELKESEDEKIRKEILEYFKDLNDHGYPTKEWTAWIEKQGESQVNKLQVSDELYEQLRNTCACIDDALSSKTLADINDYLSMARHSAQSAFDMIEKQGESSKTDMVHQPHEGDVDNPYDMTFEDAQRYASERGIDVPINDGDVFVDEKYITQTIGNILRWTDDHPKQSLDMREWTEDDMHTLNWICRIIYRAKQDRLITPEEEIEIGKWMEKWLNHNQQSNWKPTEEQLQTLHAQLNEGSVTYPEDKRVLTTLYEDLLKL